MGVDGELDYEFNQIREIRPIKEYKIDPIVKSEHIFCGGICYSIVLKESGHIELYWNMSGSTAPTDSILLFIMNKIFYSYRTKCIYEHYFILCPFEIRRRLPAKPLIAIELELYKCY